MPQDIQDIYDPLTEYVNVFRDRFKEVARDTFDELAKEANVDTSKNRETCRQLYATEKSIANVKSYITLWTTLCILLLLAVVVGIIAVISLWSSAKAQELIAIGIGITLAVTILGFAVRPRLKKLKTERDWLIEKADTLKHTAWQQMAPLNRLYDWDILTRMMTKTIPRLEFDPYFTTQRLADLKAIYGWNDAFNAERSVIFSHSGLINGNPFVICRTRKMEWGQKTYYGSKTIHWTTRERGADGKMRTVHHTETLTASVTAPFPEYFEKTRLIYGNTAAPDLEFTRKQSNLANKKGSLSYKWRRHKLRKKARNLGSNDYAMMTNEDFEIVFDTSNRNNNQQFALLFTPLAQESMMRLLQDRQIGYGDDFDFNKDHMINVIVADHMQNQALDLNPTLYQDFDFDRGKVNFYTKNAELFRAIYFNLAPLLCVPMYQQIRSHKDLYGSDMQLHSSFWEHEALANFWGQDHFKHPSCVTDCILKTEEYNQTDSDETGCPTIKVYAYGYRKEQRLTYVTKLGGDGRSHKVPVYWDEYLPVTGIGNIYMKEDNEFKDISATYDQRFNHVNKVLSNTGFTIYRRHIASRL